MIRSLLQTSFFFCIGIFILLSSRNAFPQSSLRPVQLSTAENNEGTDFYLAMLYPSFNRRPPSSSGGVSANFTVSALVSSFEDNSVSVSYFTPQGVEFVSRTYQVLAQRGLQIPLDIDLLKPDSSGEIPEYVSVHFTATLPISLTYFSTGACSGGSYLVLPTTMLGKEYVVSSYNDNPGNGAYGEGENAGGVIILTAVKDNSRIVVTPSTKTVRGHIGVNNGAGADGTEHPFTVTLNRGQCYLIKSDGTDASHDISATTIVSDKPLSVISGHENAFLGTTNDKQFDGRNMMLQQMLPVELWDSAGYYSIPFKDSQPKTDDEGSGDNYRLFTNPSQSVIVNIHDVCLNGESQVAVSKFASPISEQFNKTCPMEFRSMHGQKFGVTMYDNCNHSALPPYPAPTMMTIIPQACWKTSYEFFIPKATNELFEHYFVNIIGVNIADKNIVYSFNGGPSQPISKLPRDYISPPFQNGMQGYRLRIEPGYYHFENTFDYSYGNTARQGIRPFMLYCYGYRALDPDENLNDNNGNDFYYEFTFPCGVAKHNDGEASLTLKTEDFCSKIKVCIVDHSTTNPGITRVMIVAKGSLSQQLMPYPSKNAKLAYTNQASQDGRLLNFDGRNAEQCFDIQIENSDTASIIPLIVTDNQGRQVLINFTRYPRTVKHFFVSGEVDLTDIKYSGKTCATITMRPRIYDFESDVIVSAVSLSDTSFGFSISSIDPPLPASLSSTDHLNITFCVSPLDLLTHQNILNVTTDCSAFSLPVSYNARGALISAGDLLINSDRNTGDKICQDLTIRNNGNSDLVLQKNYVLIDKKKEFYISPEVSFPVTIAPKTEYKLPICFITKDLDSTTARIDWSSNSIVTSDQSLKAYSVLRVEKMKMNLVKTELDEKSLSIYPNPVIDGRFITLSSSESLAGLTIELYDILGRALFLNNITNDQSFKEIIPVENLANGTYYLRLTTANSIVTKKIEIRKK